MQTSPLGREIIEAFEACMKAVPGRSGLFTTYRDEVGVLTIGYGHTNLGNTPPHIAPGIIWTKQQCDEALSNDLTATEIDVLKIMQRVTLDQNQFDALVSFEFNTGHLAKSSIPAKLRAGETHAAITTLLLYNHAGGRVLNGLTRRRGCEAALFVGNIQHAAEIADIHLQSPDQEETACAAPDPAPTTEA
jgi:lysozyme